MQATQAPLSKSLNLDMRKGKFRRVNESEWSSKASSGIKRKMRLIFSNQNGKWVVLQEKRLQYDETYSHRSIDQTRPGRNSTLGTTVSPMDSRINE